VTSGPFYGFNRPGAKVSQGTIQNWWRHGMMGGAKAHYDGIKAFSETDQTADVKAITVPTLVMQGEDDQAAARHVHDECRRDQFRPAHLQRLAIRWWRAGPVPALPRRRRGGPSAQSARTFAAASCRAPLDFA